MAENMEKPYVVGMDIGGTNTVFGSRFTWKRIGIRFYQNTTT